MAATEERVPAEFAAHAERVEIPFTDLKLEKEIGRGAYSRVYRGSYKGEKVAIKKMKLPKTDEEREDQQKYINTELTILTAVSHPNLIRYYGAAYKGDNLYMVTELMEADLRTVLSKRGSKLSWEVRVRIARDAFEGIAELHHREVVHRDVKTDNILLGEDWRAAVADYGFARKTETTRAMTICGTDEFMAPEVIFGEVYDYRADVFSFGMVLMELITLKQPGKDDFLARVPRHKFSIDMDQVTESIPEDCPTSLSELAKQCLAYEPDERVDTDVVLEWLRALAEEIDAVGAVGPMPPKALLRSKDEAEGAGEA